VATFNESKRDEIKPYKYGTEYNFAKTSRNALAALLNDNVCIISFIRRELPPNKKRHPDPINARRRMLCTNCISFLDSYNGRIKISFENPKGIGLPFDPLSRNLLVTWDILQIDYRLINMDDCYLNYVYPVNTPQTRNIFWRELFNKTFYLMSSAEKYGWMNTW